MQTLRENIEQTYKIGDYTAARIGKDNLRDMAVLYHAVYGLHLPEGYYLKKYDTAYTGIMYAGFIAYSKKQLPVAYYGVLPCFLQCGGRSLPAAQSTDTMTHPDYRNQGILAELYELTLNVCRAEGIKILFGFPNQSFYPILKNKFNWEETEKMDRFEIPVSPKRPAALLRRIPVIKKIFRIYQRAILKQYILPHPELNSPDIECGFYGVLRNKQYLEYKKYNNAIVISVGEASVWIKISNGLTIGDIELNKKPIDEVITGIKEIAAQLGIHMIWFHSSKQTFLHSLFIKRYEPLPSFPVLFKDMGAGLELKNIKFTFADIDIF